MCNSKPRGRVILGMSVSLQRCATSVWTGPRPIGPRLRPNRSNWFDSVQGNVKSVRRVEYNTRFCMKTCLNQVSCYIPCSDSAEAQFISINRHQLYTCAFNVGWHVTFCGVFNLISCYIEWIVCSRSDRSLSEAGH